MRNQKEQERLNSILDLVSLALDKCKNKAEFFTLCQEALKESKHGRIVSKKEVASLRDRLHEVSKVMLRMDPAVLHKDCQDSFVEKFQIFFDSHFKLVQDWPMTEAEFEEFANVVNEFEKRFL